MDLFQTWDFNEEKCGWVKNAPIVIKHSSKSQIRRSCHSQNQGGKKDLIRTGNKNDQLSASVLSASVLSENGKVFYMEGLICLFLF